ncbi:heat shock protein Hsp15 [Kaistia soli DSM 19436]|uniref:Heat shock protein Hsp15 n=1 Tax=Kaistia soli DSM 19436 TaxID=1122133 RepID=A0A1M5CEP2_9HYPH|nr:RNA-binding S4 domain-containing protein [Kaistia soli]SHF52892.1 heat shock protein Hsp15 [Kaistia soli DSM 19436]
MSEEAGPQRIDKWLWFARFAKTRTTAQKLVLSGAVRVNRDRIDSPSRLVRVGDVLTLTLERQVRVLKVLAPGVRRGPAPEAQTLYEDVTPPAPIRPASGGERPTKRDRRAIDAFHFTGSAFGGTPFRDDGED